MQYLGDYLDDYAKLNFTFYTFRYDTGASATLANVPVISVYKGSATGTERTSAEADITLDIDFDSKTGLNHVLINLATDAFFVAGEDYFVVITTGEVNSISVIGTVVAHFSIENRSQQVMNAAILVDTAAIVVGTIDNAAGTDVATDVKALKAETVLILADTDDIGVAGAGLSDLGGMSTGMKAEVNAEAKDVLDTDTHGEPGQGAPGLTISTGAKIDLLYQDWRNKKTQTATLETLFLDNGTTEGSRSVISDDATTATKAERTTGV